MRPRKQCYRSLRISSTSDFLRVFRHASNVQKVSDDLRDVFFASFRGSPGALEDSRKTPEREPPGKGRPGRGGGSPGVTPGEAEPGRGGNAHFLPSNPEARRISAAVTPEEFLESRIPRRRQDSPLH